MNILPSPLPYGLRLVIARHAAQPRMLELAAHLAALGSLRVLDGGNQFNPLPVARTLRRLTLQLEPALAGIRLSRAFTCYQVQTLLEQERQPQRPLLVLDLLSTFYDESVPLAESRRLLSFCLQHLQRLGGSAPVVVSARPPKPICAARQPLLEDLRAACPLVFEEGETPDLLASPALPAGWAS